MHHLRWSWPAALGIALLLVVARGCSSADRSGPNQPSDAGDAGNSPDVTAGSDANEEPISNCTLEPAPSGVPSGWVRWDSYDPCCGFYVASSPDLLPPPVRWVSCEGAQPTGAVCQQMAINWPAPPNELWPLSVAYQSWMHSDGSVTLMISRATSAGWYVLLADADGPVHMAVLETNTNGGCTLQPSDIRDGHYGIGVKVGNGGGAFAGNVSDFPIQPVLESKTMPMALAVGVPGALDLNTMLLHSWTDPTSVVHVHSSSDNGLLEDFPTFSGEALFWNASSGCVSKLKVWTQATGTLDFVTYGNDATQGVGDIGTDGHDLVWMYGSGGCDKQSPLYTTASIMTAPFTTDPAQIQPRRLRSEIPNGLGVSPFVVNCGYAARQTSNGIRLVRLSDGVSWMLSADWHLNWQWEIPIALTCTEMFAQVSIHVDGGLGQTAYARVRLDSLGSGIPPD